MKMIVAVLLLTLCITLTTSITPVPGQISVRLLSNNQISNGTYRPAAIVHYTVQLDGIPINNNVEIGVEIRGSNPAGGPRGYISMAREVTKIEEFIKASAKGFQFQLIPTDIYAGYSWFLRPFVYYVNESFVSTNMMNSGASAMFTVLKNN